MRRRLIGKSSMSGQARILLNDVAIALTWFLAAFRGVV